MKFTYFLNTAPQIIIDLYNEIGLNHPTERKDYHPEPTVTNHIEMVTTRGLRLNDMNLACSGLLHDIMKYKTMKINDKTGFPTSPSHGTKAAELISNRKDIRNWIHKMGADVDAVKGIVGEHMRIKQYGRMKRVKQQRMEALPFYETLKVFTQMDSMITPFGNETMKKYYIKSTNEYRMLPSIHDCWYNK